jgi:hypothetical protein
VIIAEGGDGNARLSIDFPGDLFAVYGRAELEQVGVVFAKEFAALLGHLGLPVPDGLAD